MPESEDKKAFQRLAVVRSAKSHFLTDWFGHASDRLALEPEASEVVDRIRRETVEERDRLERLMKQWQEATEGGERSARKAREVERLARVEFLQTSMDAKTAAAEALEKVAELAPAHLRSKVLDLAGVDFEHANMLREQLYKEFLRRPEPEEWLHSAGKPERE